MLIFAIAIPRPVLPSARDRALSANRNCLLFLCGENRDLFAHVIGYITHAHGLELWRRCPTLPSSEGQQRVDKVIQALGFFQHARNRFPQRLCVMPIAQRNFADGAQRRQRRAQFVGGIARETLEFRKGIFQTLERFVENRDQLSKFIVRVFIREALLERLEGDSPRLFGNCPHRSERTSSDEITAQRCQNDHEAKSHSARKCSLAAAMSHPTNLS